jgi:hypothetical protein
MSTITTQQDGLRTFTWSNDVLCHAAMAIRPVSGILRGQQGAPEPVWLARATGHLSVVWPSGFSVSFSPTAELRDGNGTVLAREGDTVTFDQVDLEDAAGTVDDPYIASGSIGAGCYPFIRG